MTKDQLLQLIDSRLPELRNQGDNAAAQTLQRIREDIAFAPNGKPIPQESGANTLLTLGVDLLADEEELDYVAVENEFATMFANSSQPQEQKLVRAYDLLLGGHFATAIELLDELADDPKLGKLVQQRLGDIRAQQNAARDAALQRAAQIEASDAPNEETARAYQKVLFIAPNNQTAEQKLAEYTLTTSDQRDRTRLETINTQLNEQVWMGNTDELQKILGEIRQIQTTHREDAALSTYAQDTYNRFYEYYSNVRRSLGQLSTADQLGQYDAAIDRLDELRNLGAETAPDASGNPRDIAAWLDELYVLQAADQLAIAERRLDEAEAEIEEGRPIVAQDKAQEARRYIINASSYYQDFEPEQQQRFKALEPRVEAAQARYEQEEQAFKDADTFFRQAEDQRMTNLDGAINLLRQAKRAYPKYPGIDETIAEYDGLRGADIGRELDSQLETLKLDIEFAQTPDSIEAIDQRLRELEERRGSTPIAPKVQEKMLAVKRAFLARRQKFDLLQRKIQGISNALQDRDFEYAQELLDGIPSEFRDNEEVSRQRRRLTRLTGNSADSSIYDEITTAFRNSQWEQVIELAGELDSQEYRRMVEPFQQRAQIYNKEQDVKRLRSTQDIADLQLAVQRLGEAETTSNSLSDPQAANVEATHKIQRRLREQIEEINEMLKQLDEIVRIEAQATAMANERRFRNALSFLNENLATIDDGEKRSRLNATINNIEYQWLTYVRETVIGLYQRLERSRTEIGEAYRIFDELNEAGLVADADLSWYRPLLRDYYWERAQMLNGKDAVEAVDLAMSYGLEESAEVGELRDRNSVQSYLNEVQTTEREEGLFAALAHLDGLIETPPNYSFGRHPEVHDKFFSYIEQAILERKRGDDVDIRDYQRQQLSRLQPIEGYAAYTDYWRERLRVIASLRAGKYENYLVEDNKFRVHVGRWLADVEENRIFNASDALLDLFQRRLQSTLPQLDAWKKEEVDALLERAEAQNDKTLEAIAWLGWAYRMDHDDNRVRNQLDNLIERGLSAIVNEMAAAYRDLTERNNTLTEAEAQADALESTIRTVKDALRARNDQALRAGDDMARRINELDRNATNYRSNLETISRNYNLALDHLRQGFQAKDLTLFRRAHETVNQYDEQHPHAAQLTDVMTLVRYAAQVYNHADQLYTCIDEFRRAFDMEDANLAQEMGQRIRTELSQLRRLASEISNLYDPRENGYSALQFIFDDRHEIVTNTEAQDLQDERGRDLIVDGGRVIGIDDHIAVIAGRSQSAGEWKIWWSEARVQIAEWLEHYVSSLYGTECLPLYLFEQNPPNIQTAYKALGLRETVARTARLAEERWYNEIEGLLNDMPQNLYSIAQREIIQREMSGLLYDYPHPDMAPRDLDDLYLNVPGVDFADKLYDLLKLLLDDAYAHAERELPTLRTNLEQWNRSHSRIEDMQTQYESRHRDYEEARRRNRQRDMNARLSQRKTLAALIHEEIRTLQRLDPSYRCYDEFDLVNGTITRIQA